MRSMKKFGVLAVVAFALSAIGAANASAAQFTASATGSLTGKALATQVFTINGGTVECSAAASSGTNRKVADTRQHVTVKFSGCSGFGVPTVDISDATYQPVVFVVPEAAAGRTKVRTKSAEEAEEPSDSILDL